MNFFASMPFNFSFRISVPGLSNPFSALARSQASADITYQPHSKQSHPPLNPAYSPPQNHHVQDLINTAMLSDSWTVLASTPSRLPSPSPAPSAPAHPSRKRGWLPASAEPSQAIVYAAATSAFLDTPSKYRDMADDNLSQSQRDEVIVDLPPAKRRKGLTGSVISTAFSAALIGAAVGLTVYRLWRDRGKEVEQPPPPPYQEEWVEARKALPQPEAPESSTNSSPSRPSTRSRQKTMARRTAARRRPAPRVRPKLPFSREEMDTPPSQIRDNEFDTQQDNNETKDEMDWIGDKLAQLIEEGKRALGREIVVMSEVQEDEVDDCSGNWVEENDGHASTSYASPYALSSVASPPLPMTPGTPSPAMGWGKRNTGVPFGKQTLRARGSLRAHHSKSRSDVGNCSFSTDVTAYELEGACGRSLPASPNLASRFEVNATPVRESEQEWSSPAIRESMERARAVYRQKRGLGIEGL